MNATERQLRKFALIATAMLVLQLLWSGATLLQTSEPDPIYPVEASLRVDDVTGSIETGKQADMILLDRNLFEIPVTEISGVKVLKTVFGGEVVYQVD